MNAFTPVQNLKSCILNGPPLALFTLTLAICGITALSLAYYIGESVYISDPELAMDWNMFLDNFAGHEFCLMSNHSSKLPSSGGIAQLNQSLVEGIGASEELVSITATFSIVWSSPQAMNVSFIRGNMAFQNIYPEDDNFNTSVVLSFIDDINVTSCSWENNLCEVRQTACVSIRGPRKMFPRTRRPYKCAPPHWSSANNQSWDSFTSRLPDDGETNGTTGLPVAGTWCKQGLPLVIMYQPDPDLTLMLSMHDRSMINLHLMHTSYFLFVMVITVFCYAILRGKRKVIIAADTNKAGFEKVPMN